MIAEEDKDGDGVITKAMIAEEDKDGEGVITKEEFTKMLQRKA